MDVSSWNDRGFGSDDLLLEPEDPKAQAFLDLLHGLHILEYRNGQIWYDLHPVVTDLLVLKEMIDG